MLLTAWEKNTKRFIAVQVALELLGFLCTTLRITVTCIQITAMLSYEQHRLSPQQHKLDVFSKRSCLDQHQFNERYLTRRALTFIFICIFNIFFFASLADVRAQKSGKLFHATFLEMSVVQSLQGKIRWHKNRLTAQVQHQLLEHRESS